MKLQTNRYMNQNGVTLIELLVTLSLLSMVLISMYGLFTLGLRTYNKITVEADIRDEADYVVSMVLNELYSNHYDDVKYKSEDGSISFYSFNKPTINQYDDFTNTVENTSLIRPALKLIIEDGKIQFYEDKEGKEIAHDFQTDDRIRLKSSSSISLTCTKNENTFVKNDKLITEVKLCKSGILALNLVFETKLNEIKPYTLKTEIGF